MRLLVVVNVYKPDLGGGTLFADLCEGLAENGLDVEVRCAYPYYPEWRDKTGLNGLTVTSEWSEGVRVRRYGIYIPRDPASLWQRLVYEASFFLSLARHLPRPGEYDTIMAYCPLVGGVAFANLASITSGCPVWLNVQDLSAEAAQSTGMVRNSSWARLFRWTQSRVFNRATVWSTISPVMRERLAPVARRGQVIHYLPNWPHRSLAERIFGLDRVERTQESPISLLYSGNVGGKQDLLRFCRLLAGSSAEFRFEIRADGAQAGELRDWVASQEDSRFVFGSLTDETGLAKGLARCDMFVVTEKSGAGGSFIPSKLLPAYAAGTPILAVCDRETPLGCEMEASKAGPVFRWNESDQIRGLLEDPELRSALRGWSEAACARSRYFDRERIIDTYQKLLFELANRHE